MMSFDSATSSALAYSTKASKAQWKTVSSPALDAKLSIPLTYDYEEKDGKIYIYTSKSKKAAKAPDALVERRKVSENLFVWTDDLKLMTEHQSSQTKNKIVIADFITNNGMVAKRYVVDAGQATSTLVMFAYTSASKEMIMKKIADTLADNPGSVVEFK